MALYRTIYHIHMGGSIPEIQENPFPDAIKACLDECETASLRSLPDRKAADHLGGLFHELEEARFEIVAANLPESTAFILRAPDRRKLNAARRRWFEDDFRRFSNKVVSFSEYACDPFLAEKMEALVRGRRTERIWYTAGSWGTLYGISDFIRRLAPDTDYAVSVKVLALD